MTDNKIQLITTDNIKDKIYTFRGIQVMLDRDLAVLYGVETRRLNEQVKRNSNRFPKEFCFQLNDNEFENWKSQNAISKSYKMGLRKKPFVFSELGVTMLASVLKSETAVDVSVKIAKAFVSMRHFILYNDSMFQRISNVEVKLLEHDEKINEVFKCLEQPKEVKAVMFFKGQMYDASTLIKDLISSAKLEIILIDNYTDRKTLDCFVYKKKGVAATIYTQKDNCRILQSEIDDFNLQYEGLTLNFIKDYHDRF